MSFEQAASAGVAFLTAYQGIVLNGNIKNENMNQKRNLCIVSAGGGVGSYAVQVAKAINPENYVVGICSTPNISLVQDLGADKVIGYKDKTAYQEFLKTSDKFDVVLDCVGGETYFHRLDPLLTEKDVYSTAVGPIEHVGSRSISLGETASRRG